MVKGQALDERLTGKRFAIMTSSIVHSEQSIGTPAGDPQFSHVIRSGALTVMAVLMALLFVAFFVYGQIAPGA